MAVERGFTFVRIDRNSVLEKHDDGVDDGSSNISLAVVFERGLLAYRHGDDEEAVRLLKHLEDQDFSDAPLYEAIASVCCPDALCIDVSVKIRVLEEFYEESKNCEAAFGLSKCYRTGLGLKKKDDAISNALLHSAAEGGSCRAQLELAKAFDSGIIGECDPKKALYWFERAAENGQPTAMLTMAGAHEFGRYGLSKSKERAFSWYKLAAETRFPQALYSYGLCLESGFNMVPDFDAAIHAYTLGGETWKSEMHRKNSKTTRIRSQDGLNVNLGTRCIVESNHLKVRVASCYLPQPFLTSAAGQNRIRGLYCFGALALLTFSFVKNW